MSRVITEAEALRRKKEAAEAKRWYVIHRGLNQSPPTSYALGPLTKGEAHRVETHMRTREGRWAYVVEQSPIDPRAVLADTET